MQPAKRADRAPPATTVARRDRQAGLSGVHFGAVEMIDDGDGFESVDAVTFAPAVPSDAAHLWLASDDGSIRIDLR